ncbi:MAG: hypothetical protein C4346_05540, partial [Chloroflexota bacterium]
AARQAARLSPRTVQYLRGILCQALGHAEKLGLGTRNVVSLKRHRARQLEERLAAGGLWQDTGLIFTTALGTPVDGKNLTHQFQHLLASADLPRRPFHVLRHSAATFLLAAGCDLRVAQQVLGHSQVALTANLYAHVMPTLLRNAAAKMDPLLRGKGTAGDRGSPGNP